MKFVGLSFTLLLALLCGVSKAAEVQSLSVVSMPDGTELSYDKLLEHYQMPGMSLAIVDDYQLVYSQASGVKEVGTKDSVDVKTAFSAGSISKPVTAIIAVMLAEQDLINLDLPVKHYLKRWKLPDSEFEQSQNITMRQLLSHTAGTSQTGFAHYSLGDNVPTLIDSLNGENTHEDEMALKFIAAPDSGFKYSGGGYSIAQLVIEDVTGEKLAEVAKHMLFAPLAMTNTTMCEPGYTKFPTNVAKAHDKMKVVDTGIPVLPQSAAAGMWTTATDMARLVIAMQKALDGKPGNVISSWVAEQVTAVQTLDVTGGWSMGWMRYEANANIDWFSHSGYNHGIGGQVMASMTGGRAIIAFGNGHHWPSRVPFINHVVNNTIKRLGWSKELNVSKNEKPGEALLRSMVGDYQNTASSFFSPFRKTVRIELHEQQLVLVNGNRAPKRLYYMGDGKFMLDQGVNSYLMLETNAADGQTYLTFERDGLKSFALRKLPISQSNNLTSGE